MGTVLKTGSNPVNMFALLAAAVFGAAALVIWLPKGASTEFNQPPVAVETGSSFAASEDMIASSVAPIAERPLFDMSRRPIVEEVVEPAPVAEVTLSLVGILDSDDEEIALFRLSNSEEIFRLRAGQSVGGFKLEEINDGNVRVSTPDGEAKSLMLDG